MAEWFLFSPQVRLDIPVIVERAQVTDWWNVPSHQLERLDALRSSAGSARVSVQPAHGVERFYVWFADFAKPETLAEFADTVIT